MEGKKKYTKSYRTLQWCLFFGLIIAYIIYLIFRDNIPLTGLLTPTILTHFVLMILILQIQTLFEMYDKLNDTADIIFRVIILIYATFVAVYLYLEDLHIVFPLVLVFIALTNGLEVRRKLKQRKQ